jgi:hypothetical protein
VTPGEFFADATATWTPPTGTGWPYRVTHTRLTASAADAAATASELDVGTTKATSVLVLSDTLVGDAGAVWRH